jgi:hypothetical protein
MNTSMKETKALFGILTVISGLAFTLLCGCDRAESLNSSSAPTGEQWGSASEKKLVGVYECRSPVWTLQLKSDGSYAMEARESGSSFRGTWSASGSSGLLHGTYPSKATMTFSIQNDGAVVVDKYGYTFVQTR